MRPENVEEFLEESPILFPANILAGNEVEETQLITPPASPLARAVEAPGAPSRQKRARSPTAGSETSETTGVILKPSCIYNMLYIKYIYVSYI